MNVSFLDMTRRELNDIFSKFRKNIVSQLNKFLDPPQIKQCRNDWHEIQFSNVTQQTCKKYFNSFANLTVDKHTRCPYNSHRIKCRDNFIRHHGNMIRDKFDMFNGCKNVEIPINDFTTDYEMINLIVSKTNTCIPETNKYTLLYGMTENYRNKNFVKRFKEHWYRDNSFDNLNNVIPVLDINSNCCFGTSINNAFHPIMIILSIGARIIENTSYKCGCYLYFTDSGVTQWFDASNSESVFDIINGLIELHNKNITKFKSQNINGIDHAFSTETIYRDIYSNICNKQVPDNKYKLLFLSTQSFVSSEIKLKNEFPSKHYRINELHMQKMRKLYNEQHIHMPQILYWNLSNKIDSQHTRLECFSFDSVINSMIPKIKTSENTNRGEINNDLPYPTLFIRPEISQVFYNIIKDYMNEKDKHVLNAFIDNFYMNGIDGMKKFNMNFAFQYLMESQHYKDMDVRFV